MHKGLTNKKFKIEFLIDSDVLHQNICFDKILQFYSQRLCTNQIKLELNIEMLIQISINHFE